MLEAKCGDDPLPPRFSGRSYKIIPARPFLVACTRESFNSFFRNVAGYIGTKMNLVSFSQN